MRRAGIILTILIAAAEALAAERPITPEESRAIFARLKQMAGTWTAKSTKGWTETNRYEVAGKGSVVIGRSFFEGEENDGMLSTFFMDGDRLLLTHYCEAGNQPTLIAATIDADQVRFAFLSGTNLSARPGHMHSVVLRFIDADHMTSRWSFSNKGKEQWFEEIEQARVTDSRR
jgi:hypothetical protein